MCKRSISVCLFIHDSRLGECIRCAIKYVGVIQFIRLWYFEKTSSSIRAPDLLCESISGANFKAMSHAHAAIRDELCSYHAVCTCILAFLNSQSLFEGFISQSMYILRLTLHSCLCCPRYKPPRNIIMIAAGIWIWPTLTQAHFLSQTDFTLTGYMCMYVYKYLKGQTRPCVCECECRKGPHRREISETKRENTV